MRQLFALILFLLVLADPVRADSLDHIADRIAKQSEIAHVQAHDVLPMLDNQDIVIFDVREEKEYAVSHLPNAIRVNPAMDGEEFLALYGEEIDGKYALFYCSVGRRSTTLAQKVKAEGSSASEIANLRGGIFRWHGLDLPLVDAKGPTSKAHPYNWFWRRVMPRSEEAAYKPANTP